jgi:hypothetical protein
MRRRGDWRWCCYGGLTRRCGRSCRGFAGAGDKHDRKHRKHRTKNNRFLHSVNCFFTNSSSQVASADVLKDRKFCPFASRPYDAHQSRMHHLSWAARLDLEIRLFTLRLVRCRSLRAVSLARRAFVWLREYVA